MTSTALDAAAARYLADATLGNPIRDMNPLILLGCIAATAAIGVAAPGWIIPLAAGAVFVLVGFLGGKGRSYLMTFLKLWAGVGLILFVLRALLTRGGRVLVPLGPISVTTAGIDAGLRFATVVMAICAAATLFFALVPMRHLMLALEHIGVSPRVSYVLLASFQSIADLGATARVVLDAQKARGIETEGSPLVRVRAFFPVLAPVFLSAMSATEERAIALDARAFNREGAHTSLVRLRRTRPWEWGALTLLVLAAVAAVIGGVLGWF
ncbi:energy-coupling factor transporter transmembrane component T [Microbacterium capsulatum]|uniref:Energy-coupling factor transporter transmembrane component T n=1 Tax=Microbacterium capsulatum TaxID=3041921 RepID=A0ABU0XM48_9MICO|nr:energy-coupling factor transporter transmembrane component T [Microbacterium sp. ASV81]MDQ4215175.1 energy-coupling factor transporter transmembrane component T [Microbacterium sp. ASV81]